jgi:cellulose synthase/poly-beta-1,6-N-acetylglucosamine synthase-like glycosyltransferase/peptidoglycan/xylan/chitin deacetylase (PgdA/CDA1 family)
MPLAATETASDARREIILTRIAIAGTVATSALAAAAAILHVSSRLATPTWPQILAGSAFAFVVVYLVYGSLVYQVCRLGYYGRLSRHCRASDGNLLRFYRQTHAPAVTVLVPAYKEEVEVVRKTLLSAAFQTYPNRRIVLLIDDPPRPATSRDAACLSTLRRLPAEIEALLATPRETSQAAFAAFLERRRARRLDLASEWRQLSQLYDEVAAWFDRRALEHATVDHVDRHFVELTYRTHAERWRRQGRELDRRASSLELNEGDLFAGYRRVTSAFEVKLSSFERKRYANLSHEPNKAMNLNSYIGLMGRSFREPVTPAGDEVMLLETDPVQATLSVPDADYVLMVDADSVLHPEYTIRLIHLMEEGQHERIAVAQTPYSAFPDAPGVLERLAGATTDIQYIIHQGFTRYDATFWVGANALVRKRALEDIAVDDVERGYSVRKFIQDRTVIEDTESSVDLIERGWTLYNYPERLAFSATPPDFGALIIQRRRWANGGLIILPKLFRYLRRRVSRRRWLPEALMRCHYLTSLAVVNVGLLLVLAVPLGDGLASFWLPLTAVPYYALYTRDLLRIGYRRGDVLRIYALNLLLIPISLCGVFKSLRQAVTGQKTPFGRTPKTSDPTRAPRGYVVAEYVLLAQWLLGASVEFLRGHPVHAALALTNAGLLAYTLVALVELPGRGRHWAEALSGPVRALRAVPSTLLGSVKTRWTVTTLIWFLSVVFAAPGVAATELAVTIDDIPAHGAVPGGTTRRDVAAQMIRALERHSVPGVYGFANGGQLRDHPEREDILRDWRRAGLFLANHTLSHSDLTRLSVADYIADIDRNESILTRLSPLDAPKYFRYPYLHEGDTKDKRDRVRSWLAGRGYTITPATISLDDDWSWNDIFVRCAALGDTHTITRLKGLFLQSAITRLKAFEELSQRLFGRSIKHILVVHMSAFEALMLDELLAAYRAAGMTFVSLPEAMQDPALRLDAGLVQERGATLLVQIAQSRGVPIPDALASSPEEWNRLCPSRSAQSPR